MNEDHKISKISLVGRSFSFTLILHIKFISFRHLSMSTACLTLLSWWKKCFESRQEWRGERSIFLIHLNARVYAHFCPITFHTNYIKVKHR